MGVERVESVRTGRKHANAAKRKKKGDVRKMEATQTQEEKRERKSSSSPSLRDDNERALLILRSSILQHVLRPRTVVTSALLEGVR